LKKAEENVALISRSWDSATLSFSLPCMSRLTVESILPAKQLLAQTSEESTIGRVALQDLLPDTAYVIRVQWRGGSREFHFSTLPAPVGRQLSAFAAMADPHVSLKPENRKGRLFVESLSILRGLISEFNRAHLDFVLVAGDLTNMGTAEEYDAAAGVLGELACPCLAVPGDHDLQGDGLFRWTAKLGPTSWCREIKGLRLFGLNTARGILEEEDRALLERRSTTGPPVQILVSHAQIIPDDYIRFGKEKGLKNFAQHQTFLRRLFRGPALIYVGHQNVPSLARMENALQLNLPQPVQFPCGYVLVRQYKNGFYHTFQPIQSPILDEYSRIASNMAADHCGEPQWRDTYRAGKRLNETNFLYSI